MKKINIYKSFDELKSASNNENVMEGKTDEKELLELINILKTSLKSKSNHKLKGEIVK